jgi:hypothetical protein
LFGKGHLVDTLGSLFADGEVSLEFPMQDKVDKLFVVRLACSNILEVFDEALKTWW